MRAAIHPSIGIARLGDSRDEFFIGPEVDEPHQLDTYKDGAGALKRQAVRFRVYGYDAAGEPVSELTAADADISWTAYVANHKAAWYEFQIALDIPEAQLPSARPTLLRNKGVIGSARLQLVIDPGPRTIFGTNQAGTEYQFDSGTFFDCPVYLGEVRTDEAGRLLFLGGRGVSAAEGGAPLRDFANNDGWHDDIADGPVTAEVTINGHRIPVDPAWVVVAPPNYAPSVLTVRTMYDLIYDALVTGGWLPFPERTSFMLHLYPILARLSGLQWVNQGFATGFGWAGRENFLDPGYLQQLASDEPEHEELRRQVCSAFRDLDRDGGSPLPWPWIYGDSMSLPPISARQHLALSPTQLRLLERWAVGDFDSDLDLESRPPGDLAEVALADQPATLDRAALAHCLADAFHPGCELTWPVRHLSMYMAPFRIRHRAIADPEPPYGPTLTPEVALEVDGPLYGQGPGGLTRWMAVPWQADTSSCRSGYYLGYGQRYDPYLPTFWPARVPNHVLTAEDYQIVMDDSLPLAERRAAFARRANWLRWLTPRYPEYLGEMVKHFARFGVIERRPGPGDPAFPARLLVEGEVGFKEPVSPRRGLRMLHVPTARDPAAAPEAIRHAVDVAPHPDEEITAGYFTKVARFGDDGP